MNLYFLNMFGMFGFFEIIAVLWPFALVAFIFWLIARDRKKRYEMELNRNANEKGDVPPAEVVVRRSRKTNMEKGIIFISIGVGIFLCFLFVSTLSYQYVRIDNITGLPVEPVAPIAAMFKSIGSLGIIPFTIGAGYLLIHFLERKKNDKYRSNEK
jgi:Ca2+/Na+ antiporter